MEEDSMTHLISGVIKVHSKSSGTVQVISSYLTRGNFFPY